ncbi:MAG: hypothetical protein LBF81_01530 [Prevotellaceae bacterium]|jgi:hypothetical protein|nr:hypothetical protein [Prevotellaceae bacterium]
MKKTIVKTTAKHPVKPIPKPTNAPNLTAVKEEYARWVCVIVASIASFILLALFITTFYTPDMEALTAELSKITFHTLGINVRPEPVESLLFIVGLISIPVFILFYYWISQRAAIAALFSHKLFFAPVTTVVVLAVIVWLYLGFSADNPFHAAPEFSLDFTAASNFDFYFHQLFLHRYFFVYLLILFPLILGIGFSLFKRMKWDVSKKVQRFLSVTTWALLLFFIFTVIIPLMTFEFPYTWENKHDFNTVFYAQTQVYGGGAMLLDELHNNYGLYPQLLYPLFKFTGLNVYNFSFIMALLLGCCFVFQAFFLNKFLKNKLFFLFGCASIVFLPFLSISFKGNFNAMFPFFPIRFLTFSTLLFMAAFYINNKNKLLYYIAPVISSLLILWNPEMGLVSFISWIALLLYMHFYHTTETGIKFTGLKLVKHILVPLCAFVVVITSYGLIIRWSYGHFPDFVSALRVAAGFGYLGVGSLPMSPVHPWNLIILVYIIGFTYAIKMLLKKNITPKACAIFLLSVLGCGLFMYYRGRSHNLPLLPIISPALISLCLLCDELWNIVKNTKLFPLRLLFGLGVFVLAFSTVELFADKDKIKALLNDAPTQQQQAETEKTIKNNQHFIREHTNRKEKIILFTGPTTEAMYFCASQTRSGAQPSFTEMLYHSERSRYEQIVRDSLFKVFLETNTFSQYYSLLFRNIYAAVAASYHIEKTNGSMYLLTKRAMNPGYQPLLPQDGQQQIFYEVFPDDTTGLNKRRDYASGQAPIELGTDFSVEIVFDAQPQLLNYPVLVSNQTDSAGFSILCADTTGSVYGFVMGNLIYPIPVEQHRQNYIAAVVTGDRLNTFANGVQTGSFQLAAPYKGSAGNLFIGNRQMQYYVGAIREVSIIGRGLSAVEIAKRQAAMKAP